MTDYDQFKKECSAEISAMTRDEDLSAKTLDWMQTVNKHKYSYHYEWLGRPIIQFPQDIVALQEIIWTNKPDLVIETGIAHGGSLILNASLLALLDLFDSESGMKNTHPRKVLGIDIDIRSHNKNAIQSHPLSSRIQMLQGSSTNEEIFSQVEDFKKDYNRIMVILDSNHTHDHVRDELNLYSRLVSPGQYLVVFDTIIEKFQEGTYTDRSWDKGNNPMTAVNEFLEISRDFVVDDEIENKLQITVAPRGYLRRKS